MPTEEMSAVGALLARVFRLGSWVTLLVFATVPACKPEGDGGRDGSKADSSGSTAGKRPTREEAMTVKTRFEAELRAASSLESIDARRRALADLANRMAGVRLDLAWQAIGLLDHGTPEREEAVRNYGLVLAERNPAAAVEWSTGLADRNDRLVAGDGVVQACAESHLDQLVEGMLRKEGALAAGFDGVSEQVLSLWTAKDPRKASAWALDLPDGRLREKALGGVIEAWLLGDSPEAYEWMKSLPDPEHRERMLDAAARYLSYLPGPIRVTMQPSDPRELEEMDRRILRVSGLEPEVIDEEAPVEVPEEGAPVPGPGAE